HTPSGHMYLNNFFGKAPVF
ncbi:unnamed protein product, partial [Allacma fusca]